MKTNKQAAVFMKHLANRKRNPVKPATLTLYNSCLNKHILPMFGETDLGSIKNTEMKNFVAKLTEEGLTPATVQVNTTVLKALIKSAIDEEGNCLYHIKWNSEFTDAPQVNPRNQKTPTVTAEVIETAIEKADKSMKPLYALLAGSGIRVSEAFALRVGQDDGKLSYWLPEESMLKIRVQMYRGKEQDTKTEAGVRDVDLSNELNEYLKLKTKPKNGLLFHNGGEPLTLTGQIYNDIHADGIPGFHSLRRWRISFLRSNQAPEGLIKFWVGHGGGDITSRYDKSATDVNWRKEWSNKVGVGFKILTETK